MRWKNGSKKIKLKLEVFIWENTVKKRGKSDYSESHRKCRFQRRKSGKRGWFLGTNKREELT